MGLLASLVSLASFDHSPASQAAAIARLEADVRLRFARSRLVRVHGHLFDDAVQMLLLKASTGTTRFRGATEGEAYSWCRSVLSNACSTLRRRWHPVDFVAEVDLGLAIEAHEVTSFAVARALEGVVARLRDEVARRAARRPQSALRQLECFLEWQLHGDTASQLERFGWPLGGGGGGGGGGRGADASPSAEAARRDSGARARAFARLYTLRARGKRRAVGAFRSLTAARALDPHEHELLCVLLSHEPEADNEPAKGDDHEPGDAG